MSYITSNWSAVIDFYISVMLRSEGCVWARLGIIWWWAVSRHITCWRRNKEALWDHHFIFRVPGPVDHAFTTLHGEVDVGHHRYRRKSLDAGDCVRKEREKLAPPWREWATSSFDISLSTSVMPQWTNIYTRRVSYVCILSIKNNCKRFRYTGGVESFPNPTTFPVCRLSERCVCVCAPKPSVIC